MREEQERLKSRGVASALEGLVEARKLAGAKARGLPGDLRQLRAEGVKFAALTGPQLASQLTDRAPSGDELAAVHKAMGRLERSWSLAVDAAGSMTLDGLAATMADFEGRVLPYVAAGKNGGRTRPVTVADVLAVAKAGQLRAPQRQKVSFPGRFTYKEAFPEATDEPEYVIREFRDAPVLHSKSLQADARIEEYAGPEVEDWAALPPVADRLPRNPAVFEGPEGRLELFELCREFVSALALGVGGHVAHQARRIEAVGLGDPDHVEAGTLQLLQLRDGLLEATRVAQHRRDLHVRSLSSGPACRSGAPSLTR